MGAIERSRIEEHADCLLGAGRPDGDPSRGCAAELDPHVPDRVEAVGLDASPGPSVRPVPSDDQVLFRQEHRGADPA